MQIKVTAKYKRKKSFGKVVKKILFSVVGFLSFLLFFFYFDSDGSGFFFFFRQNTPKSTGSTSVLDLSDMASNITSQPKVESTDGSQDVGSQTESVTGTSGYGLNLLLINQIPVNGYAKELLTILSNNEQGMYSSDNDFPIPLQIVLGLWANESNLLGGVLPRSYIPMSQIGSGENVKYDVKWGKEYKGVSAENMTLTKFDRGIFNQINRAFGFGIDTLVTNSSLSADPFILNNRDKRGVIYTGPFQLNEREVSVWSTENGATNAGRTKRDFAYFLDDLAQLNAYFKDRVVSVYSAEVIKGLSGGEAGSLYSVAHNRGSDYSPAFGWQYGGSNPNGSSASAQFNVSVITKETRAKYTNSLFECIDRYYNTNSYSFSKVLDSACHRWVAIFSALEDDNSWFITPLLYERMKTSQYAKKTYAVLNNIRESDLPANYYEKYASRTKTLIQAVQIINGVSLSEADCIGAYGCKGDYDGSRFRSGSWVPSYAGNGSSLNVGYLFQVTTERSPVYKNKYTDGSNPFVVHCYDAINAGHIVACSLMGEYIYARLLRYSGVNVDETNPSSYKASLSSIYLNGSLVSIDGLDKRYAEGALKFGATISSTISQARLSILNEAATWIGTSYSLQGPYGKHVNTNCTQLVYDVYKQCGYGIKRWTTFQWLRGGAPTELAKSWEWIPFDAVQAGDILVYVSGSKIGQGHAVIYVGQKPNAKKGNDVLIIDSITGSQDSPGVQVRTAYSLDIYLGQSKPTTFGYDTWYCFRINSETYIP